MEISENTLHSKINGRSPQGNPFGLRDVWVYVGKADVECMKCDDRRRGLRMCRGWWWRTVTVEEISGSVDCWDDDGEAEIVGVRVCGMLYVRRVGFGRGVLMLICYESGWESIEMSELLSSWMEVELSSEETSLTETSVSVSECRSGLSGSVAFWE